ncbi:MULTISPECIES: helix-turn-helix transcriptional regulator [spotted fever group]|nr:MULTISPECIES: addiction module antidote protein, HigA family [spotted fever group]
MTNKLPPISPRQMLLAEFMEPMRISQSKLARNIDVPVTRINNIIKHHRSITAQPFVWVSILILILVGG